MKIGDYIQLKGLSNKEIDRVIKQAESKGFQSSPFNKEYNNIRSPSNCIVICSNKNSAWWLYTTNPLRNNNKPKTLEQWLD